MKEFLFTADIHLKNWNDKVHTEEGISLKLKEILNSFSLMCEYANKNKIENIIIGGDLNDTKGSVNVKSFVLFKDLLEKFNNIIFYVIPGNHDYTGKGNQIFAIDLLKLDNVKIITKPLTMEEITFLPWCEQDLVSIIKESSPNKILVSHFGLNEAQLSSGISLKSDVKCKMLEKFEIVLLGHYHKPQMITSNNTEIYYSGSLIPLRRDEINEEKRFLHVFLDNDKITIKSIPTEGYRNYYEFILNDDTEEIDDIVKKIKNLKRDGHYIIIRDNREKIDSKIKKIINEVQYIHQYVPQHELRGITSNMKLEEQFKKWCELENIPKDEIESYVSVGLKYSLTESEEKDLKNDEILCKINEKIKEEAENSELSSDFFEF